MIIYIFQNSGVTNRCDRPYTYVHMTIPNTHELCI